MKKKIKNQLNYKTNYFTRWSLFIISILLLGSNAIGCTQNKEKNKPHSSDMNYPVTDNVKWFTDARFGMFIHWTPIAQLDEEIGWSWGRQVEKDEYIEICKEWNPVKFDADQWVSVAKDAGMRYIVFVPKHHDGFCHWDTEATDFNIMNTPYGKDICQQLADACEKQGIVFCTYYSIADLHENEWSKMPYVENVEFEPVAGGMDAYFEFVKQQCGELVEKYGTKNFWFDGFWHSEWYDNDKYRTELYDYIKSLDANVIMARLQMPYTPEGGMWDDGWDFENNVGDYHSREDHGGFEWEELYYKGSWEFCSSVAYPNYSYNSNMNYKTAKEMIQTMVKVAGRNGNYLLNMAPKPDGSLDDTQVALFKEIGKWVRENGETIYGTEGGPYLPIDGDFASTRKDNKIFLHLLKGQTSITLPALQSKILSAQLFNTKLKVPFTKENNTITFSVPSEYENDKDVIIELTIKGKASDIALINSVGGEIT